MKAKQVQHGKGPLELIEETVHLLRLAPAATLLSYYLGSLPFILGLLYFWSDMSRSTLAERRLPVAALGLALLFVWMKAWHSVFAHRLLARLCGETPPRWTLARFLRAALVQGILQPSGLIVLPVLLLILVPFGWGYAFYQNVTVLGAGESTDVRRIAGKAWQQAKLWPGQNNYALLVFKIFGLFVFVDLISGFVAVPFLLKTLLGVETVFSRTWWAVFNPTFFAAMLGLGYLCLDPLAKTFYVLRCFYGESLKTGQDLKTELKSFLRANKLAAAAALLFLLTVNFSHPLHAADPMSPRNTQDGPRTSDLGPRNSFSAADLDRVIDDVISRREYNWRLPREKLPDDPAGKGMFAAFVESVFETLSDWGRAVGRWLEKFVKWLTRNLKPPAPAVGTGTAWLAGLHWLITLLIVVLVVVLAVMILRMWQRRRRRPVEMVAQATLPAPDVADESVGADELPEDGWIKLARELLDQGDLRRALRAFYLASLAHLAERGLIVLAKFKSNREYEGELGRRRHALPELTGTFAENVSVFDRVWYGLHEVNRELLDQFARNVERIKTSS